MEQNTTLDTIVSPAQITDVDTLCHCVGCDLNTQEKAQTRIEIILNYLQEWNVIKEYDADRLDWIFSDEETY
jgi:hypothetical protein